MLQRVTILAASLFLLSTHVHAQQKQPVKVTPAPAPKQMVMPPSLPPAPPPMPALKRLNEKMEYAIVVDKKVGPTAKEGDMIKLNMISACNNRMMYNSVQQNKGKPVEFTVNKPSFKSDVINLILLMSAGDSAVCLCDAQDIFTNIKKPLPDFIKKGDKMAYYIKLVSIKPFAQVQKEQQEKMQKQMLETMVKQQKEREKQNAIDAKKLDAYLAKNNIQTSKLPSGIQYVITQAGTGKNAEKNSKVQMNYKGKLLDGSVFDANVDSLGNAKPPYEYFVGTRGLSPAIDSVITFLNKGSKATIYVPSSMAFGKVKQPARPGFKTGIPENAIVSYEIEVVDVAEPVNEDEAIQKYLKEKGITGMTKTASGMYYMITQNGDGEAPKPGEKMVMNYTGYHFNGEKFNSNVDSSFNHVSPFEFTLGQGQVIKGWDEGVALLKKGAKATFIIPSNMAYGATSRPKIPAFSTLLFDVELVDIKKP